MSDQPLPLVFGAVSNGRMGREGLVPVRAEGIFRSWADFYDRRLSRLECTKLNFVEQLTYLLFLKLDHERAQQPSPLLRAANPPVIPRELSWPSIVDKTGEELLDQFRMILRQLQIPDRGDERSRFTTSHAVFAGAELRDARHIREIASLIKDEVNERTWARDRDALGGAYEQLLVWCAPDIDGNRDAGQVLTPRPLLRVVAEVLNVGPDDVVFDPAVGSGGTLVAAHERVRARAGTQPSADAYTDTFVGVDIGQTMVRLGAMNMLLNTGRPFQDLSPVTQADSMAEGGAVIHRPVGQREPTVVICNPPFRDAERIPDHRRDIKPSKRMPANFLQHIAMNMQVRPASPARAAVFLPDSMLTEGVAESVLRTLVDTCNVHTLLRLPNGVFRNGAARSGVKANVLFFDKLGPTPDGKPVSGPLWVYDARDLDAEDVLDNDGLEDFVARYCSGRLEEREPTDRFGRHTLDELKSRKYRLYQLGAHAGPVQIESRPAREIAQEVAEQLNRAQQAFADLAARLP